MHHMWPGPAYRLVACTTTVNTTCTDCLAGQSGNGLTCTACASGKYSSGASGFCLTAAAGYIAMLMILVYPLGIPLVYGVQQYRKRAVLSGGGRGRRVS